MKFKMLVSYLLMVGCFFGNINAYALTVIEVAAATIVATALILAVRAVNDSDALDEAAKDYANLSKEEQSQVMDQVNREKTLTDDQKASIQIAVKKAVADKDAKDLRSHSTLDKTPKNKDLSREPSRQPQR